MIITHLYSWNSGSEGAKVLSDALNIKRIKHNNSKFKGGPKKVVLNWGSSDLPEEIKKCRIINRPEAVELCTNKLKFFREAKGKVEIPDFTTSLQEALAWIAKDAIVCARQVLQGHSAEGLVIMEKNNPEGFVEAPLYTKYVPKADEYRIHVVNGAVTDIQKKALRSDWQEEHPDQKPNWKVRNHANGFVYIRNGINPPGCVLVQARNAVVKMGLDFGAVDVIYNQKHEKAYVLEINTAPGIEATSVVNYAAAFRDMK